MNKYITSNQKDKRMATDVSRIISLESILGLQAGAEITSDTTLQTIFQALNTGISASGYDVYDKIINNDAHIQNCFANVINGVQSIPYDIYSPESLDNKDLLIEITQFVKSNLFDIGMDNLIPQALRSLRYGFVIFEILYSYDTENRAIISDLSYCGANVFKFNVDGTVTFEGKDGTKKRLTVEEMATNFLVVTHDATPIKPDGQSLITPAVCVMQWMKSTALKNYIRLTDRFGSPTVIGKYPIGAEDKEREALKNFVKALRSNGYVTMSEDMTIDLVESAMNGSSPSERLVDICNNEISKAIQGSILISDIGQRSGSRAQGEVHQETTQKRIRAICIELAEQITNQLIKPLVLLNWPDITEFPYFKFDTDAEKDLSGKVGIIRQLVEMGVKVPVDPLYSICNIPKPSEDDEEYLTLPTTQMINTSDAKINQESDITTNLSRPAGSIITLAKSNEIQQEAINQTDHMSAREGSLIAKFFPTLVNSFQPLVNEYKRVLKSASNYNQANERLEKAYKQSLMNSFVDKLMDAGTFGYLYGRLTKNQNSEKQITSLESKSLPKAILPYDEAINYFLNKLPLSDDPDLPGRLTTLLNNKYFRIAGVQNEDLLKAIQKALADYQSKGFEYKELITGDNAERNINMIFNSAGVTSLNPHHLYTVLETNIQTAFGAGNFDQGKKISELLPYVVYLTVNDERVRPNHWALHGYCTDFETFTKLGIWPPNGFNCRCTTIQVGKATARAMGYKIIESGNLPEFDIEGQHIVGKPDKGFETNPSNTFWKEE